jgi:hypothetical protein
MIAFGYYGGKFSHLDFILPLLPTQPAFSRVDLVAALSLATGLAKLGRASHSFDRACQSVAHPADAR